LAKRRPQRPRWFLVLATVCILVLAAAAVALLALSGHERGRLALLELGAQRVFSEVQADVERALLSVLPDLVVVGDGVRCGLVPVADEPTWWELQDRIARAVAVAGASVLRGERLVRPAGDATPRAGNPKSGAGGNTSRTGDTDLLRLDIGLPGTPTHALLLYRESRGRPAANWDDGAAAGAWACLAAARGQPTIALIIDDWGYSREDDAQELLDLGAPLTLSVLPGLPYSARFANEATPLVLPGATRAGSPAGRQVPALRFGKSDAELPARRREVILHLPMEPIGYPDPDPGPLTLMAGMDQTAVAGLLDQALAGLPGVRGLNNHMGSAATADAPTMAVLMGELRRRGFFFVDSQTTDRSVAYAEAVRAGAPALRNRIFLDHDEPQPAVVRQRLATLVDAARARGFAVGIAHPHAVTAQVLGAEVPRLQAEGVRFVTVSELLALQVEVR
jgi:polysaccharide deacetylase 2 family uncharacterized protein YibQ